MHKFHVLNDKTNNYQCLQTFRIFFREICHGIIRRNNDDGLAVTLGTAW